MNIKQVDISFLTNHFVRAREAGINTIADLQILTSMAYIPDQSLTEIADRERMDADRVRKAVCKLEASGLCTSRTVPGYKGKMRVCRISKSAIKPLQFLTTAEG